MTRSSVANNAQDEEFTLEEAKGQDKEIYTIHGDKGSGKTTMAFRFKGHKYCLAFDNKSARIKHNIYGDSKDIYIIEALKHYERTPEMMTVSAITTYKYIAWVIDQIGEKSDCDWIIIDNLQRLAEVAEMCMRNDHKLSPFQGFSQQSFWKLRRVYLQRLHQKALGVAKRGLIYTCYSKSEDTEIVDGQVQRRKQVPQYVDVIEEDTDTVFQTLISNGDQGTRFMCRIITSKIPKYKTGQLLDVTIE